MLTLASACYRKAVLHSIVDASIRLLPQSGSALRRLSRTCASYASGPAWHIMKSRPQPFGSWTASVNCSDWPVTTGVQHPEKEEHFAVRQLNRNPNELVLVQRSGRSHLTVIRTHIFLNHLLSSVGLDNKIGGHSRQPIFFHPASCDYQARAKTCRPSTNTRRACITPKKYASWR